MTDIVSVLLPIYHEPIEWISRAILSVCEQSYSNIEIICIVDDPKRRDVIQYLNSLNDKRIRVFANDRNMGLIKTLNKGVRLCSGDYIARMDADDIAERTRIEKELEYLKKNNYDLVGCSIRIIDEDEREITHYSVPKDEQIKEIIHFCSPIPHPTWIAKKELYIQMNGYRNILTAEDYDFLIRCFIKGYKIGGINDQELRYRRSDKSISHAQKGRQKVTTRILGKQLRDNRIWTEEEIIREIETRKEKIELYSKYYSFTRNLRNKFERKKHERIMWDIRYVIPVLSDAYYEFRKRRIMKKHVE